MKANVHSHVERVWQLFMKLNIPNNPVIPLVGIYMFIQKSIDMYTVVLFVSFKAGNNTIRNISQQYNGTN